MADASPHKPRLTRKVNSSPEAAHASVLSREIPRPAGATPDDNPSSTKVEKMRHPLLKENRRVGDMIRPAVVQTEVQMVVDRPLVGITKAQEAAGAPGGPRESIRDGAEDEVGTAEAQTIAAGGEDDSDDDSNHGDDKERGDEKGDDASNDSSDEGSTSTALFADSLSGSQDPAIPHQHARESPELRAWVDEQHRTRRPVLEPLLGPLPDGVTVEMLIDERRSQLDAETTILAEATGLMGNRVLHPYAEEIFLEEDDDLML